MEDGEEIALSVSPLQTLLVEPDSDTNATIEVLDDDSMCVCAFVPITLVYTDLHVHIRPPSVDTENSKCVI